MLGVNLKGPFRLCALVGERMAADDGGSIINVSSTGAVRPTADIVPYAAAKAGVNAMTVGLADAFGPKVRVNAIMPGPFLTSIARNWDMDVLAARAETFPLRRAGRGSRDRRRGSVLRHRCVVVHDRDDPHGRRRRAMEHAGRGRSEGMSNPPTRSRAPLWLRAVHRLERTIGEPIESALHSDTYFDLVTEMLRLRSRTERTLEGASRRMLHLLNLPAGSDIRRVREQLGRVERRLAELSKDLDEAASNGGHGMRAG